MIGRLYLERGEPVTILIRWRPGSGGPRNVLIQRADGTKAVRRSAACAGRSRERRPPMTDRLIANTAERMNCPWPPDCYVQGGASGVVFREGGAYRTAFVEAFPAGTFLRGEGPTIAAAEAACWAKYERLSACPHRQGFERRNYVNGSGFCKGCGTWFGRDATGFDPLPEYYEPSRRPSLMERAFLGDMGAAAEIVGTVARVQELPETPDA